MQSLEKLPGTDWERMGKDVMDGIGCDGWGWMGWDGMGWDGIGQGEDWCAAQVLMLYSYMYVS